MSKKTKNQSRSSSGAWVAIFGFFQSIVERFGWPGFILLYAVYFIERNATTEEKRAIIDLYALGKGTSSVYPTIILGVVGGLAFLAQWGYYRKKLRLMEKEIKRLAEWKTAHQERKTGDSLHHSKDPEE